MIGVIMSNEINISLRGTVGTDPKFYPAKNDDGVDYCSFRLASTKRHFSKAENQWVDGDTLWFTIKAWRSLASNISKSLKKSDPVYVAGTFSVEEWESEDGSKFSYVIDAASVGHDLVIGTSSFERQSAKAEKPKAKKTREKLEKLASISTISEV
jgi:single-strand DNA-binding protein